MTVATRQPGRLRKSASDDTVTVTGQQQQVDARARPGPRQLELGKALAGSAGPTQSQTRNSLEGASLAVLLPHQRPASPRAVRTPCSEPLTSSELIDWCHLELSDNRNLPGGVSALPAFARPG
jgi:hypothetical protein